MDKLIGRKKTPPFQPDPDYMTPAPQGAPKCEAGCMGFEGGERKHTKGCVFYPESLTKLYADKDKRIAELEAALTRQADNMAYAVNNMNIPDRWYDKFMRELKEDRRALKADTTPTQENET